MAGQLDRQLNIYVAEESREEALDVLNFSLAYAWFTYALTEDEKLMPFTRKIKKWLLDHAEQVV